LSAVATSTSRLKLGLAVTPLAPRRPQVVANALASLDLLSGGRVVLGAGLGGNPEAFTTFGEPGDAKERAAMLDEGLAVLDGLLSGEPVTHHGHHRTVEGVSLAPLPLQRPRIPTWIGGESASALRRAARWDGWLAPSTSLDGTPTMSKSPERIAEMVATIRRHRTTTAPFRGPGGRALRRGPDPAPRTREREGCGPDARASRPGAVTGQGERAPWGSSEQKLARADRLGRRYRGARFARIRPDAETSRSQGRFAKDRPLFASRPGSYSKVVAVRV
jgi:hypothetical protein